MARFTAARRPKLRTGQRMSPLRRGIPIYKVFYVDKKEKYLKYMTKLVSIG